MTDAAAEAPLLIERHGAVLVLTLNRPRVRNAVNRELAEAMAAAVERIDSQTQIGAAVIQGAGGTFSAGMDLKEFARTRQRPTGGAGGFAGIVRRPPRKPVVAAIEGHALGGGLEVALACDLIVAARGAWMGIPEVKRSIVAGGGAMRRLPRLLPAPIAAEMALTGDPIEAERAFALGAVNRLTEPGQAGAVALELATAIAANGPLATAASKRIMAAQWSWAEEEFFDRQAEHVDSVLASDDALEGAAAFAEKRRPRWSGS